MTFNLTTPPDDGLTKAKVGYQSTRKHYFLSRYIDIFTGGMKKKWPYRHYVDLFAGPGIEQLPDGDLAWGSPLIAAQSPTPFDCLHLNELDPGKHAALDERIKKYGSARRVNLTNEDANEVAGRIAAAIPGNALTLAFLDPFGLHLEFETVQTLATKQIDLIVFFPDYLDTLRNWRRYLAQDNSNLDRFLGTRSWRDTFPAVPLTRISEEFRRIYVQQFQTLNFLPPEFERITMAGGKFLYGLLFFSRHERGCEFWRKIAATTPDQQRRLF